MPVRVEKLNATVELSGAVGVVEYDRNGTRPDELVARANLALQYAETDGYGNVRVFEESSVL
jgi:GGDEF domain-containing protein